MSQDHRLQQQRFELKYLIEESLTEKLRGFISRHLELDELVDLTLISQMD